MGNRHLGIPPPYFLRKKSHSVLKPPMQTSSQHAPQAGLELSLPCASACSTRMTVLDHHTWLNHFKMKNILFGSCPPSCLTSQLVCCRLIHLAPLGAVVQLIHPDRFTGKLLLMRAFLRLLVFFFLNLAA